MTTGSGCIEVRGLTRRFGDKVALSPLELDVGPGGVTGLLGPNGSGKSTLLRMLVGLVRPNAGSASVDGVALAGDGTAVRKCCAYAPGEIALYGDMRADQHLRWFVRGRGDAATARAFEIAAQLELPLKKRIHTYSHGMKRQLMFAAAMAPDVRVRILDEPSEGLDPNKRSTVLDLLEEDAARGTTILLSSHHLGEVDRSCATFVFVNDGKLVSIEDASSIRERASRLVRLAYGDELADPARREALVGALAAIPGVDVKAHGGRVVVELEGADPRAFLGALANRSDLPQPRAIEYGEVSLQQLYRDLYGVEAC
jgi:ABC-2 type transport system ATP-binding protein